jgi:hypothetical protein
MSYIGNIITGNLSAVTDFINGDASTTQFTLSRTPASPAGIMVFLSGVYKVYGVDWTLNGSSINFTSAPPSGTNNIIVQHLTNGTVATNVPSDGAINSSKMSSNVSITNFSANATMTVPVFTNNTARSAAITSPQAGMIAFVTTGTQFQGYNGSSWIVLSN